MNIVKQILTCGALLCVSQGVSSAVVSAEELFALNTPATPSFTLRQSYGGMYGMAAISLFSPKEVQLNMDCEETVKLYYGEEMLTEVGVNSTGGCGIANMTVSLMSDDDGLIDWETPGIWVFMFDDSRPASMRSTGDYSVVIPEGLFTYGDDTVGGITLNYSLVAQIPDSFSHTITPESGTEFTLSEPLQQISISISGTARYVGVDGPVGGLYDPEGNKVECATYRPKVSGTTLTWTLQPAGNYQWTVGEYKFIIPANSLYVNSNPDYAMSGNYPEEDIELSYIVSAGQPTIPFDSAFTYETPSQAEFSFSTSYRYEVNDGYGMGAVVLSGPKGVKLQKDCQDAVELMYEGRTVATITEYSGEDAKVHDVTVNFLDDSGLLDFGSGRTSWLFEFDREKSEAVLKPGHYTVKIPAGLFMYEESIVGAGSLEYDYQGDIKIDYPYTITPEAGTEFSTSSPIKRVTITIGGYVRLLDYAYTPGALYGPDGNALSFQSRYATVSGNELIWKFDEKWNNRIDWVPGEYTFKLPRNTININCWADAGIEPDFPEEDINILYILKDGVSGVCVTGIERADSYTVYTLDGRVVAVNGPSDVLLTLPEGFYIINGKKACVK